MNNMIKPSLLLFCLLAGFTSAQAHIQESIVVSTINTIQASLSQPMPDLEKGVRQVAHLWREEDGTQEEFQSFCIKHFASTPEEKRALFDKTSFYFEAIFGHFNEMSLKLNLNLHLDNGPLHSIDPMFAAYSPSAHLIDDLYRNKIGFIIALNFPEMPLSEKEKLGSDRLAWAYSRMGDLFTERIAPELLQAAAQATSDADVYISHYNIFMGSVLNTKGEKTFPEDKILLSHWNLRDEIKTNYNKGAVGTEKQRTIYEVMKRIVSQEIPREVINSGEFDWNPYTNELKKEGQAINGTPESTDRYEHFLQNFRAQKAMDSPTGKTFIERSFSGGMEISVESAKELFHHFLSSPELKKMGKIISKRIGRKLEAYDIWYDGFKPRSNLDEIQLDRQLQEMYPTAQDLEKGLPKILVALGFTADRADEICQRITVDAARGSGHAWGAEMKGQQSRLRTRIPAKGMDYKGYNIAIHEFGHNVEQTVSIYDVDHYMLRGVPNTSFTEALAFIFQDRDLFLLGIEDNDPTREILKTFDKVWSLYEIMGVSLLDISVWEWLYANPDADAASLRDAVVRLSKEVWNQYYAPVFGKKDETVLGIYSHMVSYPLYLSAYAYGQIIEFQIEDYIKNKPFAQEVDRIFRLGRLTPNEWMREATGNDLSVDPMLRATREALSQYR